MYTKNYNRKTTMLYKAARLWIRPHHFPYSFSLPRPAVYLVRHDNLKGPLHAFVSLPDPPHIWVLDCFFRFQSCYRQYCDYTFSKRKGQTPKKFSLRSAMAAAIAVPLVKLSGAIPVYRGKRNIGQTFEQSLKLLLKGESLVIAANKDYDNCNEEVKEIYTGFFRLDRYYFAKTGEHLPFIALSFQTNGSIQCSHSLIFDNRRSFHQQRKEFTKIILQHFNESHH